jgi:hypothetical protein
VFGKPLAVGIATALSVFGHWPEAWRKKKSVISPTGEMSIRGRIRANGKMETRRYRLTRGLYAQEWVEDETPERN